MIKISDIHGERVAVVTCEGLRCHDSIVVPIMERWGQSDTAAIKEAAATLGWTVVPPSATCPNHTASTLTQFEWELWCADHERPAGWTHQDEEADTEQRQCHLWKRYPGMALPWMSSKGFIKRVAGALKALDAPPPVDSKPPKWWQIWRT